MAEILITYSLLMNDILYNIGDNVPVLVYEDEAGCECELKNAEIIGFKETTASIEFVSGGNTYLIPENKLKY